MNIIDQLGCLMLRLCSIFRTVNKRKNVDLFTFKRNLTLIKFNDRIFIKFDNSGQEFIENCLSECCKKYEIKKKSFVDSIIADSNRANNDLIYVVWYNDIFKFEFVLPEHWKHLEYSCQLATHYDLMIGLDSIFVHSVTHIEKLK